MINNSRNQDVRRPGAFPCDLCGERFDFNKVLGSHKLRVHGIPGKTRTTGTVNRPFPGRPLSQTAKPQSGVTLDEAIAALKVRRDSTIDAYAEIIGTLERMRQQ